MIKGNVEKKKSSKVLTIRWPGHKSCLAARLVVDGMGIAKSKEILEDLGS
jgi:hypothetical protein